MIERFKYIQNVGRFEQVECQDDPTLSKLSLIYSENGRGKTTLCAILRSLTSGDSAPVLERRRLSATTDAKVVVRIDGKDVVFDGKAWSAAGPPVLVFDEHFVDANVYSGLSIEAGHRQNLHVLVIGEEGVKYQRRVEELGGEISKLQSTVREKEAAVTADMRGGFSVDDFCALSKVDDIDTKLADLKKSVSVLRDAQEVQDTHEFTAFALPLLPADDVREVLRASLPEVEQAAVTAVGSHLVKLGDGAETWVADGMGFIAGDEKCPFCDQDLTGSSLLGHYRAYFSKAYHDHKVRIESTTSQLARDLGGDAVARVQRTLQQAKERHEFWGKYIQLPELTLDIDGASVALTDARDTLLASLRSKREAPLEPLELDADAEAAVAQYETVASGIRTLSESLLALNESVTTAKEKAEHGSLATAEAELARLEAIARRHDVATAQLCYAYSKAKLNKAEREVEKEEARTALKEHRDKVFGTYQAAMNGYLVKFNADFRVEQLEPSDARGVPSSTYEFVVNKTHVTTAAAKDAEPSFGTVLSAGDRNTLALAFFFASLQARTNLDDAIVVIDDPASSLDDGRAFATVQEIRALIGKSRQVIVLAHARPILCQLWERADKDSTATLEIRNVSGVADASTLENWDAEAAAVTEYDRLHMLIREYGETSKGEAQDVAVALRPVLEGLLRVAFVDCFSPGQQLGDFLTTAKQAAQNGSPILDDAAVTELDNLREYANQFHHNTSKNWQENRSNVNEQQLSGYARRVVAFTHLGRPSP